MGLLINGVYYKNEHEAPEQKMPTISSQSEMYRAESQVAKHDKELIQPYLPDGSPNPEFAKYYPQLAKDYGMENLL